MTITGQIRKIALEILAGRPDGIRYSELGRAIQTTNPSFNSNTINGATWDLDATYPKEIYKPDRGVFRLIKFREEVLTQPDQTVITKKSKTAIISEEDFYQPFADWLVNELEECTSAIALGGNIFKDKWGTPDVIGKRESKRSDIIQFPTEIISAEIKTDSNGLITAFGQSCAYKIFSHKSYIVVPKESQVEDITRLDTLCRQFGIGLILFNHTKKDTPNFEIRVRATRHDPDMFFVNKNLKLIEDKLFK
ncbi:MAG TPA: hypothetical protein VIK14_04705 [Ignavibacteria bacterium]